MHQVQLLSADAVGGNPTRQALLNVLKKMRARLGQVYSTTVVGLDKRVYRLTTTSRDLHAWFGQIDVEGRQALCAFLVDESGSGVGEQFIVGLGQQMRSESPRKFGILVTALSSDEEKVSFQLETAPIK